MKVFIPFNEELMERLGLNIGELVPFQLEYECLSLEEQNELVDTSPDESPFLKTSLQS